MSREFYFSLETCGKINVTFFGKMEKIKLKFFSFSRTFSRVFWFLSESNVTFFRGNLSFFKENRKMA